MKPLQERLKGREYRVLPYKELSLFPTIEDRAFWDHIHPSLRKDFIARGESQLGCDWPPVRATHYMAFTRTGSRTDCETPHFARRNALLWLLAAECAENGGRFLDDIIDGVFAICEETSWAISAHISSFLPVQEHGDMDLFALETAGLLSYVYHLLKAPLDRVSPLIRRRIWRELELRIIQPYLRRDDYWWQGFTDHKVNNWAPWCTSNVLVTFLMVCEDDAQRRAAVEKAIRTCDSFIDVYHDDGMCDEGPGYWGRAGQSLMDCLVALHEITGGDVDIFDVPLIRNMGTYIADVRLAGQYYLNFADGSAVNTCDGLGIYRYGKMVGSPRLMAEGAYILRNFAGGQVNTGSAPRLFPYLRLYEEAMACHSEPVCRKNAWFQDTQALIARQHDAHGKGLVLGAKGGHNAESHNHNDIGSYVVFDDGQPILIDLGVETYSARTFNEHRYEIWTMRSDYHTLPTFGHTVQQPGQQYRAREVRYSEEGGVVTLSMELSAAYGPEDIGRYVRTLRFDEKASVITVHEDYVYEGEAAFHFMTFHKPEPLANGVRILSRTLTANQPATVAIEEIQVADKRLAASWPGRVFRVTIRPQGAGVTFTVQTAAGKAK